MPESLHFIPLQTMVSPAKRTVPSLSLNRGIIIWGFGFLPEPCLPCTEGVELPMSPTVFREGPLRFYFFSREETRVHVHVLGPTGEAKFWLAPTVSCASHSGFADREVAEISRIIVARKEEILDAWHRHFPG
ncbi:MAG: DUF4160 domain-containing protein [Spirochaetota bacterium]